MARIRSTSDAPVIVAGVRLEKRGDTGEVDPAKPGVAMLAKAERIELLDPSTDLAGPSASDLAARVAVLERELASVRAELESERALNRALSLANAGLQGPAEGAKKVATDDAPPAPSAAAAEAPGAAGDASGASGEPAASEPEKPARKKGG